MCGTRERQIALDIGKSGQSPILLIILYYNGRHTQTWMTIIATVIVRRTSCVPVFFLYVEVWLHVYDICTVSSHVSVFLELSFHVHVYSVSTLCVCTAVWMQIHFMCVCVCVFLQGRFSANLSSLI